MLLIEIEGEVENMELLALEIFKSHDDEIRKQAADDIAEALDNDDNDATLSKVVFKVYLDELVFDFNLNKTLWKTYLDTSLVMMEQLEEYEACAKIKKVIDRMENESKTYIN